MVLIAYASKTGTTAECAAQLAALLPGASLCDLTKETPEIGRFDAVIVGGCVRMGALHKAAAGF
ncbi:MAG TPA: GNAT family acetyltransferase, partial [Candidatus Ruminococcus gallistercoris]|nr:GNAT family acetyltransferase [Candidatus Ruminococcus gallistercoris]